MSDVCVQRGLHTYSEVASLQQAVYTVKSICTSFEVFSTAVSASAAQISGTPFCVISLSILNE